jgi:hypothetical protein
MQHGCLLTLYVEHASVSGLEREVDQWQHEVWWLLGVEGGGTGEVIGAGGSAPRQTEALVAHAAAAAATTPGHTVHGRPPTLHLCTNTRRPWDNHIGIAHPN